MIKSPSAYNPLYLKVVLSELRVFGDFDSLGEKIRTDFGDTPLSAFEGVLRRLEYDPAYSPIEPKEAVPLIFSLLAHARNGLSSEELTSLLIQALDNKKSMEDASDTVHLFLRQVRHFLARRDGRYDFFFESFKNAALKRYVSEEDESRWTTQGWHRILADYFYGLPLWEKSESREEDKHGHQKTPNRRKVSELPHHQANAKMWDELEHTLTDFDFLQAKVWAVGPQHLIDDYDFAPYDADDLRLIQGALRLSAHILAQDKIQLAGQLLGRLLPHRSPKIQILLTQASQWNVTPWLQPLTASLTTPGGMLLRTLEGHTAAVNAVAFTPDGRRVISASDDKTLKVWDMERGVVLHTLTDHTAAVNAVAVTPDGRHIVSAAGSDSTQPPDNTLRVWDIDSGERLQTLQGHTSPINAVAVTPDGRRAVSSAGTHNLFVSSNNTLKVWDLDTGVELFTLKGHIGPINAVAVTPDGHRAVSAAGFSILMSLDQAKSLYQLQALMESGDVDFKRAQSFGSDSTRQDCTIKVWDLDTGKELLTLHGHTGTVRGVAVTPDGKRAVSCADDKTLKIWDMDTGQELRTLYGHTGRVWAVVVTSDGRKAISASDNDIKVWDLEHGVELRTYSGHTAYGPVNAVAVTPDGRLAVSGGNDKTLKIWDLEREAEQRIPCGHSEQVSTVAVTPDGKHAISISSLDRTLKVWNLAMGNELYTLTEWDDDHVVVTPDGTRFLSGGDTIKLWDFQTGQEQRSLTPHKSSVSNLMVTSDGHYAVIRWNNKRLTVWDLMHETKPRALGGRTGKEALLVLTPDGKRVISSGKDGTIKIWDLRRGVNQLTLGDPGLVLKLFNIVVVPFIHYYMTRIRKRTYMGDTTIKAIVVSPDGQHAVSSTHISFGKSKVGVWDLTNGKELWSVTINAWTDDSAVMVTQDSKYIVFSPNASPHKDYDDAIKVWDLETGVQLQTIAGTDNLSQKAMMPDGQSVIATSTEQTLKIWDIKSGELIASFSADGSLNQCAISPDGTIVVGEASGRVHFLRMNATPTSSEASSEVCSPITLPTRREVSNKAKLHAVSCSNCGSTKLEKGPESYFTLLVLFLLVIAVAPLFYSLWWVFLSIPIGLLAMNGVVILFFADLYHCYACGKIFYILRGTGVHARLEDLTPGPPITTVWESPEDSSRAFGCPLCRKWSVVPASAMGTELLCPNCRRTVKLNNSSINADWRVVAEAWCGRFRQNTTPVSSKISNAVQSHAIRRPITSPALGVVSNKAKLREVTCPNCRTTSTIEPSSNNWLMVISLFLLVLALGLPFHSMWWLFLSVPLGIFAIGIIVSPLIGGTYLCPTCRKWFYAPHSGKVHVPLEDLTISPPIVTAWRSVADANHAFGCPLCCIWSEIPVTALGTEFTCPNCGGVVKLNSFTINADWRSVAEAWRPNKREDDKE